MQLIRQSNGQSVVLDMTAPLGSGGEAHVYTSAFDTSLVAKLYRQPTDHHSRKLAVMVANPPADPMAAQGHVSIAWPLDLLATADASRRTIGYLMPRAVDTRPLIYFYNPFTRRKVSPLFNALYLLRTGRNLAAAIHAVHARGYVIGDINESNILVTDTALVTLVDTDSFQVRDPETGDTFRCPVGKPEFTPPELQREVFRQIDRTPEHDRFGLAVLLFQLLMEGTHPFAGIYTGEDDPPPYAQRIQEGHFQYGSRPTPFQPMPVAPPFETLNPNLRELFVRCFDAGHTDSGARPDAETWVNALQEAENDLVTCRVNSQHRYGKHLNACPWCARRIRFGGRDPFPSKETVRRGEHLTAVEPSQQSLPSAATSVPKPPPGPSATAPSVSVATANPVAASAPSTTPDGGRNLHPATPAEVKRPTITATRGAKQPPSRTRPRWSGWVLIVLLAAVALLAFVGAGYAQRQKLASEISTARQLLITAQATREKLQGQDIASGQASTVWNDLKGKTGDAQRHLEAALGMDTANAEAKQLREQVQACERGGNADYEALQARVLLDEVVQSIGKYKNQTLTEAQATEVQQKLKDKCRAALEHCSQALALEPHTAAAWVQRVRAYRLSGDTAAATAALKDAQALFPGDSGLHEQEGLLTGG